MKTALSAVLHFLTSIAKIIAVYGFTILLVIILGILFWGLGQGQDIMISVIEKQKISNGLIFYLSVFFYVFVAWYSSRVISYRNNAPADSLLKKLHTQIPRLIGFFIYAIIIICLINAELILNNKNGKGLQGWPFLIIVVFFFIWYYVLYSIFNKWCAAYGETLKYRNRYKTVFYISLIAIVVFGILKGVKGISTYTIIFFLLVLQVLYLFLVISRRKVIENDTAKQTTTPKIIQFFFKDVIAPEEQQIFMALNIIAIVVALVYAVILCSIKAARGFGSFEIVVTALGLWAGFINLLNMLASIYKINFGFILLLIMFAGGFIVEPHYIRTIKLNNDTENGFTKRLSFEAYFDKWYILHATEFQKDSAVTLLFTLGDGGASRSGYWVASVLGSLQDTLGTSFSNHLFCLSGASGGSVGNATYYAELYLKTKSKQQDTYYVKDGTSFLKTDFLSYPLARLLGPGIILNPVVPVLHDRAWALEKGIIHGADAGNILNGFFGTGMSQLLTGNVQLFMPALCINTTRMQDAMPGVISTVKLDSVGFSNRIDVLSLLPAGTDIPFATATILGARFPYFSPAGAIKTKNVAGADSSKWSKEYFVDGGYFDNSGAGVVHEMIQRLEEMKADTAFEKKYAHNLIKMRYCVIHITNSPIESSKFDKIHPLKNDLTAPLVTLSGSYGSQTSVNDLRLESYIQSLNKSGNTNTYSYYNINLYNRKNEEPYPMNWAISNHSIHRMDFALQHNDSLAVLKHYLYGLYSRK